MHCLLELPIVISSLVSEHINNNVQLKPKTIYSFIDNKNKILDIIPVRGPDLQHVSLLAQ